MKQDEKDAIKELLDAIEQIESSYGYIFKGSDEHQHLRQARSRLKKLLKRKTEG